MRIALFSTSWLDFYVVELVRALASRHELLVIVDQHDVLHDDLGLPSVRVARVPWLPTRRHPLQNLRAIRELASELSAFNPDAIHFQEHDPRIPLLMPFLSGVPIVLDLHNVQPLPGMEAPLRDWFRDTSQRRIGAFVVHGTAMTKAVHARYGANTARVFELPFGRFSAFGASTNERTDSEMPVALFFGRIEAYKGIGTLTASLPHVALHFRRPFKLVIAGEGNLAPYLPEDLTRIEIVNERVDDPSPFFRNADLVVMPYTHASTSGVTPVAYAHEKPVIVTNVGSLAETVRDTVTGLVVPARDPAALGAAIAHLFNDAPLRRRMGKAGRELLDGPLHWDNNIASLEAAYQHAADQKP